MPYIYVVAPVTFTKGGERCELLPGHAHQVPAWVEEHPIFTLMLRNALLVAHESFPEGALTPPYHYDPLHDPCAPDGVRPYAEPVEPEPIPEREAEPQAEPEPTLAKVEKKRR